MNYNSVGLVIDWEISMFKCSDIVLADLELVIT